MLLEGQQLRNYRLVRLLKSRGMGEVYLAVDTLFHRQVAIKVIQTDSIDHAETYGAKESAHLFLREAQANAQLDQINILPLYDSGEERFNETAVMYMVMPYRQAGSPKDWQRAHSGQNLLPLPAVERIVNQAALALQHAHSRQIIHQDVKPSNFLVHVDAEHPSRLDLQLADCGVAKFMMKTSENQVIRGTPTYMAPEQWGGHPVPATDQYAVAVMAYELLTGRSPFLGDGYHTLWYQHCHVEPEPPGSFNPLLPQELDAVLLRALAKRPENRYSSVLAFAHAFQRAVLNSVNVYQTVTISMLEAQTGTNRVFTLPTGQPVILPILPGAYHGQVIRLEGYSRPTAYNSPPGALIVTIAIASVEGISPTASSIEQTVPVSRHLDKNNTRFSPSPVFQRKRHSRGLVMLMVALILVLLAGGIGYYYVMSSRAPTASRPSAATQAHTAKPTISVYPSYLHGIKGTISLYDSLKVNNRNLGWVLPDGICSFTGETLDVKIAGDPVRPGYFRTCITSRPIYRDFAYEVKMTFMTKNLEDCGGVTFHTNGLKLYYFYICQNGQYSLVRYAENVSDPNINPLLKASFCPFINVGSSQPNVIAVVVQGRNIDLYVNQHYVGSKQDSVEDPTYSAGTIGVLAKTFGISTTELMFSDAKVWQF
jgi:eukaryotic-like serine/threonine-protein kinase